MILRGWQKLCFILLDSLKNARNHFGVWEVHISIV